MVLYQYNLLVVEVVIYINICGDQGRVGDEPVEPIKKISIIWRNTNSKVLVQSAIERTRIILLMCTRIKDETK